MILYVVIFVFLYKTYYIILNKKHRIKYRNNLKFTPYILIKIFLAWNCSNKGNQTKTLIKNIKNENVII